MIKLFVMDVDGTMTDGAIYLDGTGGEFKRLMSGTVSVFPALYPRE